MIEIVNGVLRFFLWVLLLTIEGAFAQDGTLDETFGVGGVVLPTFGGLESENHFLVVQRDGKIVTGETVSMHGVSSQFYLVRYNLNGSHDATFGIEGIVISDFPEATVRLYAMEIQPNGKIIGAGILSGVDEGSFLVRYNSDGTLDFSFGSKGVIFKRNNIINSFGLQPDGRIIVSESFYENPFLGFVNGLTGYMPDGILDTDFGVNGYVMTPFRGKSALQTDGKIVFYKDFTDNESSSDFVLLRYLSNGTLDLTFGTNGTAIIDVENNDELKSIKIQPDGKVLFIGHSWSGVQNNIDSSYYELIRLLPNGNLDIDFGKAGINKLMISSEALEIQPDRKIIVVGGTLPIPEGPNQIAVSRFLTNGDFDIAFGNNGIVTTSLGESIRGSGFSVKLLPDGKIVVGGIFCEAYSSCNPHSFIVRYNYGLFTSPQFNFQNNTFLIYPNPVSQIVNLDFNFNQPVELSVSLYDINGREVSNLLKNKKFEKGHSTEKLELPGALSKGVYFLNVSNGGDMSNIKIVK
jgi:uncharacterized delta-60 repeat protein